MFLKIRGTSVLLCPCFFSPSTAPTTAGQAPAPTSPFTALGPAADWDYIGSLLKVGQDLAHISSRIVDEENMDEEGVDQESEVIDQQGREVPRSITPSGLICVGEGVDAVAECRREQATPSQDYSRDSDPKGRDIPGLANPNKTFDVSEEHINPCSANAPTSVTPASEPPSGAPSVQTLETTTAKRRLFPEEVQWFLELLQTTAGGLHSPAASACGNPDLASAPAVGARELSEATSLTGLVEPADVDDADAADMVGLFQAVLPGTPTGEARHQILKIPLYSGFLL